MTLHITPIVETALAGASKIRGIAAQAREVFIDREDAINAMALASVAGEHILMLGPPGTGKSRLIRFFAEGVGQSFFRLLLNPDTQRDDLVGPVDPTKLMNGVWDRAWAGLATSPFVFLDEVGKASSQVINMTLDAMEERLVTSAGQDREIPLHLLAGATNEELGEDVEAAMDRFTLRVMVRPIQDSHGLIDMLLRSDHEVVVDSVSSAELRAMRQTCKAMAHELSLNVRKTIVRLWSGIRNVSALDNPVTDRRWKKLVVIAAAQALLDGRTEIDSFDLLVAKHILWTDVEEISQIQTFIIDTIDSESAEIRAKSKMVDELEDGMAKATGLEARSRVNIRADKLLKDIQSKGTRQEWADLRKRLLAIKEQALA